ncbi:polycystin-2 [Caerostris extrusa]|uniref:Polycystin-2 n=1 Tax=Caerostris extrusa TaxID=172846 RepID=A0AAV4PCL2_CAEEX|nr:polycystin-2 [Caerostris extrusa]
MEVDSTSTPSALLRHFWVPCRFCLLPDNNDRPAEHLRHSHSQLFQDVKEDIGKQANDYEIVDFMWKKLKGFFFIFDDDKPKNDDDFDNDVKPIF